MIDETNYINKMEILITLSCWCCKLN